MTTLYTVTVGAGISLYFTFRGDWLRWHYLDYKARLRDLMLLYMDPWGGVRLPVEHLAAAGHARTWKHWCFFWRWNYRSFSSDPAAYDFVYGPLMISNSPEGAAKAAAVVRMLQDPNVRAAITAAREAGAEMFTLPDGTQLQLFALSMH